MNNDAKMLSATQVRDYLTEHTDFFNDFPELLNLLTLPHPVNGQAISLIERQVLMLREQNTQLDAQLTELVSNARDNEQLCAQLHRFAKALFNAQSIASIVTTSQTQIRELFKTDFVSLRLLVETDDTPALEATNMHEASSHTKLSQYRNHLRLPTDTEHILCGKLAPEHGEFLFRNRAKDIQSAAVMPLLGNDVLGWLGLGSRDAERFNDKMGHWFLLQLSELIGCALAAKIA